MLQKNSMNFMENLQENFGKKIRFVFFGKRWYNKFQL